MLTDNCQFEKHVFKMSADLSMRIYMYEPQWRWKADAIWVRQQNHLWVFIWLPSQVSGDRPVNARPETDRLPAYRTNTKINEEENNTKQ